MGEYNITNTIINEMICLIFSIIATVVSSILLPAISSWIKSKTENEILQTAISDITTTVQTTVNQYEQTMVTTLKKCGKWDTDAQRNVLERVVEDVVENLLDTTKRTLENNGQGLEDVVTRYIESYIRSVK